MTTYLSAVPAYGRDYKSKAEVLADWKAGKDFQSQGFHGYGYFNADTLKDKPAVEVNVRYANLAKVAILYRFYRNDDGEAYYLGRIVFADPTVSPDDAEEEAAFGPLHDFAGPNDGATEIQYRHNGRWVTL